MQAKVIVNINNKVQSRKKLIGLKKLKLDVTKKL